MALAMPAASSLMSVSISDLADLMRSRITELEDASFRSSAPFRSLDAAAMKERPMNSVYQERATCLTMKIGGCMPLLRKQLFDLMGVYGWRPRSRVAG